MSLRVRLAVAFAAVALGTALAVALAAPVIVGHGFAAMQEDAGAGGMGHGNGPGPMAGMHAGEIQQQTTLTIVAVALGAAAVASLLGVVVARRVADPLARLGSAAASVARGELDVRSGLADRSDELGALGRSFDAMAGELQGAEAVRRRFFQDAAHELKTPLAVIDATTAAVLDGVYPHEDRHLETIRAQSRLLGRIVDDLRTVGLADEGALPLRRERVDVDALLAAVAADVRAPAAATSVAVEVGPDSGAFVDADPDRLRQVVGALVDNALRHTPSRGVVRLVAARTADRAGVSIAVTDSGPGIAESDLPHVFERFYRADRARDRATTSSGLGLAIVRALVEAHGGRVRAGNVPGGGARFEVVLPAAT